MKKSLVGILLVFQLSIIVYAIPSCAPGPLPDARELTIVIQPFSDVSPKHVDYVLKRIKKVYANTVLVKPIKLPAQAWYPLRSRYRADSIYAYLSRRADARHVIIGLTSKDISSKKGNIADWGVMGLGYQPGNACVVSVFRLNKKNLLDQFFKICVHELGHTQGLPHCENKTCYMLDAEGGNPTDRETGFCPKCKQILERKGWVFE
jgi:archaemetzincin